MESSLYKRNITYRVRTIGNKSILFGENQCFELNELALVIWNNIGTEKTISDLVDIISKEYDVDKEVARKDATEFINEMVKCNVILESK